MRRFRLVPLALLTAACAVNPVTGKRELSFISETQEIQMGQQLLAQSRQQTGFYQDLQLTNYIADIGLRMAEASERPSLPWEFHLLDDPVVNAYAAPGGFIFITRGILAYMNSEAELAGVLGHEIGHVTARHSANQLSKQQLFQTGFLLGSVVAPGAAQGIGGQLAQMGSGLLLLKYGRDDESQSDALGHRYSLQAGYDVREMSNTFLTLQRVGQASGNSAPPALLSSHPDPGDRAVKTMLWADTVSSYANLTSGRDRFLDHLDGMVYAEDPRSGYFEGDRFLHPTLLLQFDLPAGWQRANQATRVVAADPNGRAQFELTQSQAASAQAAAEAFAGTQQLQVRSSGRTTVNGLPAHAVSFRVAGAQQSQTIEGQAVFVEHRGAVYQLLGVMVSGAGQQTASSLDAIVRSFRPTASNQIFRRVRELDVITPSRATTPEALAAASGGAATAQEIAFINSLEPGASIPAGRKVKTVRFR